MILYPVSTCIDRYRRLWDVTVAPRIRSVARRMSINRLSGPRPRSFVIMSIKPLLPSASSFRRLPFDSTTSWSTILSTHSYPTPLNAVILPLSAVPARRNPTMAEAKEIELLCNNLRCVADQTSPPSMECPVEIMLSVDVEWL